MDSLINIDRKGLEEDFIEIDIDTGLLSASEGIGSKVKGKVEEAKIEEEVKKELKEDEEIIKAYLEKVRMSGLRSE